MLSAPLLSRKNLLNDADAGADVSLSNTISRNPNFSLSMRDSGMLFLWPRCRTMQMLTLATRIFNSLFFPLFPWPQHTCSTFSRRDHLSTFPNSKHPFFSKPLSCLCDGNGNGTRRSRSVLLRYFLFCNTQVGLRGSCAVGIETAQSWHCAKDLNCARASPYSDHSLQSDEFCPII